MDKVRVVGIGTRGVSFRPIGNLGPEAARVKRAWRMLCTIGCRAETQFQPDQALLYQVLLNQVRIIREGSIATHPLCDKRAGKSRREGQRDYEGCHETIRDDGLKAASA